MLSYGHTDGSDLDLCSKGDDSESDESSQDELCYIRDHRMTKDGMELYVTWVKGGRDWHRGIARTYKAKY